MNNAQIALANKDASQFLQCLFILESMSVDKGNEDLRLMQEALLMYYIGCS